MTRHPDSSDQVSGGQSMDEAVEVVEREIAALGGAPAPSLSERLRARSKGPHADCCGIGKTDPLLEEAAAKIDAAEKLAEYGDHKGSCGRFDDLRPWRTCDCGYEAALAAYEGSTREPDVRTAK